MYPPARTPEIAFYRGDAPAFHAMAAADAPGLPFHPPLTAWVAKPFYAWSNPKAPQFFPNLRRGFALIGALVVGLVWWLAWRLTDPGVAAIAGALAATHFGLAATSTTLNAGHPNLALALGGLWALSGWSKPWRAGAAGLLLALAALARAEDLLLIAAAALWLVWRAWPTPRPWQPLAYFALGAGLVLGPNLVANARTLAHFNTTHQATLPGQLPTTALVSIYGGLNFWLANHPGADGTFDRSVMTDPTGQGQILLTHPAHFEAVTHGYARGWQAIRQAPRAWGRLVRKKVVGAAGAYAHGYGVQNWGASLAGTRQPVDLMTPHRTGGLWLHLALAAAGAVCLWRRTGAAATVLLHLPVLVKWVAIVLFFGYARLANLTMPILLIDVALALAVTLRALTRRTAGRGDAAWAAGLLLLVAFGLLPFIGRGLAPQEIRFSGENVRGTSRIHLDGRLELEPVR